MPIYEYACEDCGAAFEIFHASRSIDPPVCVHCQSQNVRKLVSNCSFQLKGSGWYVTDYARKDGAGSGGPAKKEPTAAPQESQQKAADKKAADKKTPEKKTEAAA